MKGAINALLIVCTTVFSLLCPKSMCETPKRRVYRHKHPHWVFHGHRNTPGLWYKLHYWLLLFQKDQRRQIRYVFGLFWTTTRIKNLSMCQATSSFVTSQLFVQSVFYTFLLARFHWSILRANVTAELVSWPVFLQVNEASMPLLGHPCLGKSFRPCRVFTAFFYVLLQAEAHLLLVYLCYQPFLY